MMSESLLSGKGDENAFVLALGALGWVLSDSSRADRLLALTGLTADQLRSRIADRIMLAAVLSHLEGHEPDLVACAAALESTPEDLMRARIILDSLQS